MKGDGYFIDSLVVDSVIAGETVGADLSALVLIHTFSECTI